MAQARGGVCRKHPMYSVGCQRGPRTAPMQVDPQLWHIWRAPSRDVSVASLPGCLRGLCRLIAGDFSCGWEKALARCLQGVPPVYSRARLRETPAAAMKEVPALAPASEVCEPFVAAIGGA
uniref:Uncharacterized protein n=1 Tax=Alexandrium catenella TaxID=2925 RepID=A0A7S1WUL6_ALECA